MPPTALTRLRLRAHAPAGDRRPDGRPPPRRRRRARRNRGGGRIAALTGGLLRAIGRLLRGSWMIFAHVVGATSRAIGAKARDLDPAHRRDGAGLAALGAALVIAGGVWWRLPGPIGAVIVAVVRGAVGSGAVVVPVLLVALAWRTLRHPDRASASGRIVIGWGAVTLGVLGLLHIAHGSPDPSLGATAVRQAGGTIGFMVAAPLESGLTVWLTVPLLGLLGAFGVLVVTATPVNGIPQRLMELRDFVLRRKPAAESDLLIDLNAQPPAALRRGSRRRRVGVFSDAPAVGDRPYDTPLLADGDAAAVAGVGGGHDRHRRRPCWWQ